MPSSQPAGKTSDCLSFSDACPEHVLVNWSFVVNEWLKKRGRRFLHLVLQRLRVVEAVRLRHRRGRLGALQRGHGGGQFPVEGSVHVPLEHAACLIMVLSDERSSLVVTMYQLVLTSDAFD